MADSKNVIVGCKLPHGITLEVPGDTVTKVTLNGVNSSKVIGADHGVSYVDGQFWDAWIKENSQFPAIKSGAIFVASDSRNLEAKAKANKGRKTGFEKMKTDGKDSRASGTKPADKD